MPNWAIFMRSDNCLLFQRKSWVMGGGGGHFIVLIALWMKEMTNYDRSGMTSYCSIVCCE